MALRMTAPINAGEAAVDYPNAYLQARPLVLDKDTRQARDEEGAPVLEDGQPVVETYWYQTAEVRFFTDDPAQEGKRLRTHLDHVKIEVDLETMEGDPVAALYTALKADPRFAGATDA